MTGMLVAANIKVYNKLFIARVPIIEIYLNCSYLQKTSNLSLKTLEKFTKITKIQL
jgi:hypothetical protein